MFSQPTIKLRINKTFMSFVRKKKKEFSDEMLKFRES